MRQLDDSFRLAEDARAIATALIAREVRFAHLGQARFACVHSEPLVTLHGGECAALVGMPSVQGPFKRMFDWMLAQLCEPVLAWEEPDFLILIDVSGWRSLDPIRRERLMYHELCHVVARLNEHGVPKLDAEGRPMLRIVRHDAEFFEDEVATYGTEVCGLEDACLAIAQGIAVDKRRAARPAADAA